MALELSPGGRRYGYLKDKPDHRDYGLAHAKNLSLANEQAFSHMPLMGPILDQGDQGSCTAHAAAADREFLHWSGTTGPVEPDSEGMYSPSFLYYLERQEDGTLSEGDCGSYGRTSCRVLRKYGCALRSDMPYLAGDFSTAPTDLALQAATKWTTGGYHRLGTVADMKSCIASGFNFRIGFNVYQSFESINSSGLWTPDKREAVLGGHEVLGIGFDDRVNGGSFEVFNSWGESWGMQGRFWLRYQDAADPDVLLDAWIQHLGEWK